MFAPSFRSYLDSFSRTWHAATADPRTVLHTLHADQRSQLRGYIRAELELMDGSIFFLREFIDVSLSEPRVMYAYHYQDRAGRLIFRYDNALHRPRLSQPEHKHTESGIITGPPPPLHSILDEVLAHLD